MDSKEKLRHKIQDIKSNLDKLMQKQGVNDSDIEMMIKYCNEAYPLLGFVNWRFQEEFLRNLREFEHRFYINVTFHPYIKTCVSILDRILNQLKTEEEYALLIPTQKYYLKSQKLELLKDVDTLFSSAKDSILYYDPYADYVIASLFEGLMADDFRIMLSEPNAKFQTFINAFEQQAGKKINFKQIKDKNIHDRYCLIDNSELWLIGGSINYKNINSVTVTKIIEEQERNKIIKDLEAQWETE